MFASKINIKSRKMVSHKVNQLVCHALPKKQIATSLSVVALAVLVDVSVVRPAIADISGLTPCAESKAFTKRKNQQLQKRMKKYEADSAPTVALKATMERTEKRFELYAKSGLLCGTDGLPHLIADPGFALKNGHAGDVFIPTFAFLYFAGWLGHSGRLYLEATRDKKKEIIIDVPLAFACLGKAIGWPVMVFSELRNGTLLEKVKTQTIDF